MENPITGVGLKKKKSRKWIWWIVVPLIVVLLGASGYFGYNYYSQKNLENYEEYYRAGYINGASFAVNETINKINQCPMMPVTYTDNNGNHTLSIFTVDCIAGVFNEDQRE